MSEERREIPNARVEMIGDWRVAAASLTISAASLAAGVYLTCTTGQAGWLQMLAAGFFLRDGLQHAHAARYRIVDGPPNRPGAAGRSAAPRVDTHDI